MLKLLVYLEHRENRQQKAAVLNEARQLGQEVMRKDILVRNEENLALEKEEFEDSLREEQQSLQLEEALKLRQRVSRQ